MDREALIQQQLANALRSTNFDFLKDRYEGKVRDNYRGKKYRYIVTTDRLSCFDKVVACIPFKGQVLNQLAVHWFKETADIVANHFVDSPDPNVMVVKECEILPVEVVVRSYLAGSAWRDYESKGKVSGVKLPDGLKRHEKLPEVIMTPSTKAERGEHDMPISEAELLAANLVTPAQWDEIKEKAFALFTFGEKKAEEQGLLFVDTKYEFGMHDGKIVLADEIHTLDSSRYWVEKSYGELFEAGESPVMLDKEPTRQWLLDQGYQGDGPIPHFTEEHLSQISEHYIQAFQWISGLDFNPVAGDPLPRIANNIRELEDSI